CTEGGLFPVDQGDLGPQCFGAVTTAISHMKCNDLASGRVHRDPDPLLIGFFLHETPHLIGFGLKPAQYHIPPDLVVAHRTSAVESSSPLDFLSLHVLWTLFGRLAGHKIMSIMSAGCDFTTKSGGI